LAVVELNGCTERARSGILRRIDCRKRQLGNLIFCFLLSLLLFVVSSLASRISRRFEYSDAVISREVEHGWRASNSDLWRERFPFVLLCVVTFSSTWPERDIRCSGTLDENQCLLSIVVRGKDSRDPAKLLNSKASD
jgi:hypothetical protein